MITIICRTMTCPVLVPHSVGIFLLLATPPVTCQSYHRSFIIDHRIDWDWDCTNMIGWTSWWGIGCHLHIISPTVARLVGVDQGERFKVKADLGVSHLVFHGRKQIVQKLCGPGRFGQTLAWSWGCRRRRGTSGWWSRSRSPTSPCCTRWGLLWWWWGGGSGNGDGDLAKEQQTPNPPPQDPDASPCFALKWFQVMRKTTTIWFL